MRSVVDSCTAAAKQRPALLLRLTSLVAVVALSFSAAFLSRSSTYRPVVFVPSQLSAAPAVTYESGPVVLFGNVTLVTGTSSLAPVPSFSELTISARIDEQRAADVSVSLDAEGRAFFALQLEARASGQVCQLRALAPNGCVIWMRYLHVTGASVEAHMLVTVAQQNPCPLLRLGPSSSAAVSDDAVASRASRGADLSAAAVGAVDGDLPLVLSSTTAASSSSSSVVYPPPVTLPSSLYARDPYLHALSLRQEQSFLLQESSLLFSSASPAATQTTASLLATHAVVAICAAAVVGLHVSRRLVGLAQERQRLTARSRAAARDRRASRRAATTLPNLLHGAEEEEEAMEEEEEEDYLSEDSTTGDGALLRAARAPVRSVLSLFLALIGLGGSGSSCALASFLPTINPLSPFTRHHRRRRHRRGSSSSASGSRSPSPPPPRRHRPFLTPTQPHHHRLAAADGFSSPARARGPAAAAAAAAAAPMIAPENATAEEIAAAQARVVRVQHELSLGIGGDERERRMRNSALKKRRGGAAGDDGGVMMRSGGAPQVAPPNAAAAADAENNLLLRSPPIGSNNYFEHLPALKQQQQLQEAAEKQARDEAAAAAAAAEEQQQQAAAGAPTRRRGGFNAINNVASAFAGRWQRAKDGREGGRLKRCDDDDAAAEEDGAAPIAAIEAEA